MLLRGLDHGLDHGAVGGGGAEYEVRHHLVERGARRDAPFLAPQLGIDRELHRRQDGHPDLGKQATAHLVAAEAREVGLLEALDADRHHHGA